MKESKHGDRAMMTAHQRKQVRTRQRQKENFLSLFRKVSKTKDTEFIYLTKNHYEHSTNLSTINDKQDSVQNRDLPNTNYLTGYKIRSGLPAFK